MSSDPLSAPISIADIRQALREPVAMMRLASPAMHRHRQRTTSPIAFNNDRVSMSSTIIVDSLYELPATMRINAAVPPPPLPHWLRPPNRNYEANND